MSTKKKGEEDAPENAKASPMTYESVNLPPRVVAGRSGVSEADVAGLGPAAPATETSGEGK